MPQAAVKEAGSPAQTPGRGRIYNSIIDTIGDTPLVRLKKIAVEKGVKANLLAKLEFFNPIGSVKDRIGVSMIAAMEAAGKIAPGRSVLIEPTSGNTGIALAFVAAARGYRLILGHARIDVDRAAQDARFARRGTGTHPRPARHERRHRQSAGACRARFPAPRSRSNSTIPPIPRSIGAPPRKRSGTTRNGEIDVFVSAVGTGGTITGVAKALKPRRPSLRIVAVEPEDSAVLSGGQPGPHKIQGIGAGFIPSILDRSLIDEVVTVGNQTAFDTARLVARLEGIPVGISSGAAVAAAVEVGLRPEFAGKNIVLVIPSFAERYLSTALFDGL